MCNWKWVATIRDPAAGEPPLTVPLATLPPETQGIVVGHFVICCFVVGCECLRVITNLPHRFASALHQPQNAVNLQCGPIIFLAYAPPHVLGAPAENTLLL